MCVLLRSQEARGLGQGLQANALRLHPGEARGSPSSELNSATGWNKR